MPDGSPPKGLRNEPNCQACLTTSTLSVFLSASDTRSQLGRRHAPAALFFAGGAAGGGPVGAVGPPLSLTSPARGEGDFGIQFLVHRQRQGGLVRQGSTAGHVSPPPEAPSPRGEGEGEGRTSLASLPSRPPLHIARPMSLDDTIAALRACRVCHDAPRFPPGFAHEPRPIVQASATARLCIASQAPGTLAHAKGVPFMDPSGVRLRRGWGWTRRPSTTPRAWRSCRWAIASPARTPRAATCRRDGNAPRSGGSASSPGCRSSSSSCASANTRCAGIWQPRCRGSGDRNGDALARDLRAGAPPPRAAPAPSELAQQWLAEAASLVRGRAAAGASGRGRAARPLSADARTHRAAGAADTVCRAIALAPQYQALKLRFRALGEALDTGCQLRGSAPRGAASFERGGGLAGCRPPGRPS